MDKYLRPERFYADPSTSNVSMQWEHYKRTFRNFLLIHQHEFEVANFVPTRKGSLLLVHNGFAFRLKNKLAYGKKQWYCTSRPKTGCHVDVITAVHRKGSMIKRIRNVHNHPAPGFYRTFDGSYKVV